jgi:hypothetical protein
VGRTNEDALSQPLRPSPRILHIKSLGISGLPGHMPPSSSLPLALPGMSSARLNQITQELQKLVDDGDLPGAAFMVTRGGKYVYHGEVGRRNEAREGMKGGRKGKGTGIVSARCALRPFLPPSLPLLSLAPIYAFPAPSFLPPSLPPSPPPSSGGIRGPGDHDWL